MTSKDHVEYQRLVRLYYIDITIANMFTIVVLEHPKP